MNLESENYIKVLDKGFIALVDYMGSDESIERAARTSYGKGTRKRSMTKRLLRYLKRNKHTSPFEMAEFVFHIKMPIFVARQHIRHRTASVNEYSLRYSEAIDDYYVPDIENLTKQSTDNKQGRDSTKLDPVEYEETSGTIRAISELCLKEYKHLLSSGVAKEIARIILPVNFYTEMYWKIDLHNLMHYLRLRDDSHAQYEIREYAKAMYKLVKPFVPISVEAWEDYDKNSISLTPQELSLLTPVNNLKEKLDSIFDNEREKIEFLRKIGIE